jgi:phenylalanine-4-hydroxylase
MSDGPKSSRSLAGAPGGGLEELVELDRDHPGFRDPEYRARRNAIARLALDYRPGDPVPDAEYTEAEHAVWAVIGEHLAPLHRRFACRQYLEASEAARIDPTRIPQLREVNAMLAGHTGFQLLPVGGLVTPERFLLYLADRAFLATQYIRHHSRPLYTPEPDIVHELVGHAAFLVHPEMARLNRAFGDAAERADEARIQHLIRLYWFTIEFGLVREAGELKVVGAGLLSSFGELGSFADQAELRPFAIEEIVETPFDPTDYQSKLFVAPSFDELTRALHAWL